MTRTLAKPTSEQTPVGDSIAFADAALGAAGHVVTDPRLRSLMRAIAQHEMSADEAIAVARRHIQG